MGNYNASTIGLIIKNHRKQAGLTQFELSELIEIDDKQLGKIERGVHYPSVPTFLKIIKALNIDINEFYSGDTPSTSVEESRLMRLIRTASPKELDLVYKILEVIRNN